MLSKTTGQFSSCSENIRLKILKLSKDILLLMA